MLKYLSHPWGGWTEGEQEEAGRRDSVIALSGPENIGPGSS